MQFIFTILTLVLLCKLINYFFYFVATYLTTNLTCEAYSEECYYQMNNLQSFDICSFKYYEDVSKYKCLASQMVIIYDRENYTV